MSSKKPYSQEDFQALFSQSLLENTGGIDLNNIIEIRNALFEDLLIYAASLSQELLNQFETGVAVKLRNKRIDISLAETYINMSIRIQEEGLYTVGRELIQQLSLLAFDLPKA